MNLLKMFETQLLKKMLVWCTLAVAIGVLAGFTSTLFLNSVDWAINFRKNHPFIIIFLPLSGFLMAYFYKSYGKDIEAGSNLIIEEIHDPKKTIPLRMMPMIFIGTVSSHLFGASVGREGAAVQMAASLSDQFSKHLGNIYNNRKIILMMGISAGFASVFGTPIAGAVFGLEVIFIGQLTYEAMLPCLVSAIAGFYTAHLLGVVHPVYFFSEKLEITIPGLFSAIIAGIAFGYAAKLFIWSLHQIKDFLKKHLTNTLFHPVIGGCLLVALYFLFGSDRYHSLGKEVIITSFNQHIYPWDFLVKIFMTALSVGSGFKGGEVMSLFYMGATLGNALSYFLPLGYPVLASLGFVSVFAGAANTPITGIILAYELFGPGIGVYAALAVVLSYLFSGTPGIYQTQRTYFDKNI
ncbi:MAG: chloride channel protein [Bdellovibrionales bacterium]|nr:chloride channel protein [Bdellovibrionales bacterium]